MFHYRYFSCCFVGLIFVLKCFGIVSCFQFQYEKWIAHIPGMITFFKLVLASEATNACPDEVLSRYANDCLVPVYRCLIFFSFNQIVFVPNFFFRWLYYVSDRVTI